MYGCWMSDDEQGCELRCLRPQCIIQWLNFFYKGRWIIDAEQAYILFTGGITAIKMAAISQTTFFYVISLNRLSNKHSIDC